MRKLKSLIITMPLLLLGCATSDVVQIGENYIIFKEGGTPALGQTFRLSSLKADALREANKICLSQKKSMEIVDEVEVQMSIGVFARYELEFNCE